jgi:hypothetical protein
MTGDEERLEDTVNILMLRIDALKRDIEEIKKGYKKDYQEMEEKYIQKFLELKEENELLQYKIDELERKLDGE